MSRPTIALVAALALGAGACSADTEGRPVCSQPEASILVLEAQSVPSATELPCIAELPIGWQFTGSDVRDAGTTLWLDHDRAGVHAVEIRLISSCDVASAVEVPPAPDEVGMRVYQEPISLNPFVGSRTLVFDGGCIISRYGFARGSDPALVIEADRIVSTLPREMVVAEVRRDLDLTLCGAEAPPCAG
ncbi:MAG: hypothetical protein OEV60_03810 [Actinomycetota bacterium]|nr:hypothetical protein [Actinomycetota bacterium]MDH5223859.1 hypothetical protein [Actinomycetota bacterium]MDH5313161.1 hypothetical protein [Actinomycetota bacterium]